MQPILRAARVKTHTVNAFKGIWRAGRAPEGYFADAVNLTGAVHAGAAQGDQRLRGHYRHVQPRPHAVAGRHGAVLR